MKKLFYAAVSFAALAATVSCSKEESTLIPQEEPGDVVMVKATISAESSESGTKTVAEYKEEDGKYRITWEQGDALSVFNDKTTAMARFTAGSEGELTEFTGEIPSGSKVTYAILPYDENATLSGTSVLTGIPTEQDGDFGNIVLAGWPKDGTRAAATYDFKYQFEAVCGILKFHFNPSSDYIKDGETVVSISITADRVIAGDAKISYASGKPVMTPNPNASGSNVYNTITISKQGGFTEEGDYYFATFPVNVSEVSSMGISIRFVTENGRTAYVNATLPGKSASTILSANVVKNIGTVKIKEYVDRPFTSGEFTVNAAGGKVVFSRGNLQYQASSNTFRFAPNQWDALGEKGNCTKAAAWGDDGERATQTAWIDLFPWGHSGWEKNGVTYYPYRGCHNSVGYYSLLIPQDGKDYTLTGENAEGDWGVHNAIVNGNKVDAKGTWRLPSPAELKYMLGDLTNPAAPMRTVGTVESKGKTAKLTFLRCGIDLGVKDSKGKEIFRYGLLMFPDGFTWPEEIEVPFVNSNIAVGAQYINNGNAPQYTLTQLSIFEEGGTVFLPNAGGRNAAGEDNNIHIDTTDGTTSKYNIAGHYWTNTIGYLTCFAIYTGNTYSFENKINEGFARSVRLVQDVR